ncbi:hypothetical protein [Lederbergia citri]|nr:hypothetical protein [Lederbergia citri]
MKANEVFEIIKNLEAEEKWNLLNMLYDEYYTTRPGNKSEIDEDY